MQQPHGCYLIFPQVRSPGYGVICFLICLIIVIVFPQGKRIEAGAWGGNTSTKVGVWIWQEPGAGSPYTQCGGWREPWAV